MSSTMVAAGARTRRWHKYPPQAPSPRIFLRRPWRSFRRKGRRPGNSSRSDRSGNGAKLETLFDGECMFSKDGDGGGGDGSSLEMDDEEKWRFQAEVLRAERNLMRMEKEIAGRKKICEGKNVAGVAEEEIPNMVEKLKELRESSRSVKYATGDGGGNFDQRITILQKSLQKLGGSILSEAAAAAAAEGSIPRSTSGSKPVVVQCLGHYVPFICRVEQQEVSSWGMSGCSGHCKAVVRRIVELVRAETEQWSQLQEMVGQVREEMEELLASRDFWEDRARDSDAQNRSLHSSVQEWRQMALLSEAKAKELRLEVSALTDQIGSLENDLRLSHKAMAGESPLPPPVPSGSPDEAENRPVFTCSLKENRESGVDAAAVSGIIDRRRKVHSCAPITSIGVPGSKRPPLRDVGNSPGRDGKPAMAIIADFMLVYLPAPTVPLRPVLATCAGPIAKFFYRIVSLGISPPLLRPNGVAVLVNMIDSTERMLEPLLRKNKIMLSALCFAVRTGNTYLGSLLWVDYTRWVGVQ
ncbi:hypothetical protein SAY86_022755 [Trapa natans]|uniref:Uncharacterized protein n=1 Tax=Trapa natans TaxID=22666 RepID=A0AAN7R8P0_TRANT|nr:hypothetical protein SAY86_022755 [Trapa natans]